MQNPDSSGRGLLLSLLLLAALTAVALLTRPLMPIDETRYVSAAWEMWLRGDFLVPFKNGEPYSHKPPFMFWMFHAGWALFGVNDWWPRLVLPLFSAGALLLTYSLARRLWPQRAGLGGQATLVLVSALLWIVFSTSVMFDVMLAFWVLFGMHGVLAAADGKRRGFVMLGIAIGMGVLTKGPVILLNLLPITVLALWWNPGLKWGRWFGGVGLAVLLGAAIALAVGDSGRHGGRRGLPQCDFLGSDRRPHGRVLRPPAAVLVVSAAAAAAAVSVVRLAGPVEGAGASPANWSRSRHALLSGLDAAGVCRVFLHQRQAAALSDSTVSGVCTADGARAGRHRSGTRVGLPALLAVALGGVLILAASGQIAALNAQVAALPPLWPGVLLVLLALGGLDGWAPRGFPAVESGASGCRHAGVGAAGGDALALSRSTTSSRWRWRSSRCRTQGGRLRMPRDTTRNISSSAGWKRRWSNCRVLSWHAGWRPIQKAMW